MRRVLAIALVGLLWLAAAGSARAGRSGVSDVAAPSPPPIGTPVAVRGVATFTGLACAGPSACVALGQDAAGDWKTVAIDAGLPDAAVAVPAAPAGDELTLTALACASATLCEAVGSLTDADGDTLAAVVSITSGRPGAPQVVADPDGPAGAYDALSAVACPSAGVCEAVGEGEDPQSVQIASGVPGPLVHDDDPLIGTLSGILCAGGSCAALGSGGADGETGIVAAMDGPSLGVAEPVAHTASLTAGACPPASGGSGGSGCVLLSSDALGRTLLVPVGAAGLGDPGGVGTPVRLSGEPVGVACPSAGSCVVLGTDAQGSGTLAPIALSGSAAAFGTTVAFPVAPAAVPVCVSASSCLAVGAPTAATDGTSAAGAAAVVAFGQIVAEVPLNVGAAHVHGTAASLVVRCSEPCAGRVRETARLPLGSGRASPSTIAVAKTRTRTVAVARTARFRLTAAGRRTLSLHLNRAGRRALAAAGRLPVLLTVLTTPSGSSRPQIAAIRSATLRGHRMRRRRGGPATASPDQAGISSGPPSSGERSS